MVTREALEARKAILTEERDNLISRVHAFGGAIEDCDYWLAQLAASEQPELEEEKE